MRLSISEQAGAARLIVWTLALHAVIIFVPLLDLKLYGPTPLVVFADVPVFFAHASRMLAGGVPYRDFLVEYPPLALPIFLLPRLVSGGNVGFYAALFGLEMLLWDGLCVVLVASWARRRERPTLFKVLLWYTVFFGALYPFVGLHYDMVPATVAFAAAAAWGSDRPGTGGVLAACAVLLKAFPGAVALPGIVGELRKRGSRAPRGTAAFVLTVLVGGAVWWAVGAAGAIRYQVTQGLEIESLWAGALAALGTLRHTAIAADFFHAAYQLRAPGAEVLARAAIPLQGLALLFVAWRIWRVKDARVIPMAAATMLAVVVTGKAFSPQYMVWFLPFAAVSSDRWTKPVFFLAALLTTIVFPWRWGALVAMQPETIGLLCARNALLAALLMAWLFGKDYPME